MSDNRGLYRSREHCNGDRDDSSNDRTSSAIGVVPRMVDHSLSLVIDTVIRAARLDERGLARIAGCAIRALRSIDPVSLSESLSCTLERESVSLTTAPNASGAIPTGRSLVALKTALDYVQTHLDKGHLSLHEAATRAQISESHLRHLLKQIAGTTFLRYVRAIRAERA